MINHLHTRYIICLLMVIITIPSFAGRKEKIEKVRQEQNFSQWRVFVRDPSLTYQQIVKKCDTLFADYVSEQKEELREKLKEGKLSALKPGGNDKKHMQREEEEEEGENEEYAKYARWCLINGPRLDAKTGKPIGNLSKSTAGAAAKNIFSRNCSIHPEDTIDWSDWHFIGPQNFDVPRLGRVNCINVNPGNSQEVYVSDCWGGLWKTTNGGTTWASLSDNQFNVSGLGVSRFAVDFNTSPHRILAAVGYITEPFNLDLAPSTDDIYYSYNDGGSFTKVNYNAGVDWGHEEYVSDMKMHPDDHDKIFITTKYKVMRVDFHPQTPTPGAWLDVIVDYDGYYNSGTNQGQHFNGFHNITFLPAHNTPPYRPHPMVVSTRALMDMHHSTGTLLRTDNCFNVSSISGFTDITADLHTSAFNSNGNIIQNSNFSSSANWNKTGSDWNITGGVATSSHAGALPYTTTCLEQTIMGYLSPKSIGMTLSGTVTLPNNTNLKIYLADNTDAPWTPYLSSPACGNPNVINQTPIYESDTDPGHIFGSPYNFSIPVNTGGTYFNRIYAVVEYKSSYSGGVLSLDNISLVMPHVVHVATGTSQAAVGTLYSMVTLENGYTYVQRSTDYGVTWSSMGYIPGIGEGWGSPDCEAMVVSSTDPDKIFYSGFHLYEFNAGQTSGNVTAYNYQYWPDNVPGIPTHADLRSLAIRNNGSDEEIYVGHDGGMSAYNTTNSSWSCYTCGTGSTANAPQDKFQCSLPTGIATDVYNGDVWLALWDNGYVHTNRDDVTQWNYHYAGDGWRVKVPRRYQLRHATITVGNFGSSIWQYINVTIPSANGILAPSGAVISYGVDALFGRVKTTDVGEYYGANDVFRLDINTTTNTSSWNNLSSGASGWISSGKFVPALAGCPDDPDVVGAFATASLWEGGNGVFQFTTNGGASWTSKTNPFSGNVALDMAIDPKVNGSGKHRIWAGMAWYNSSNRVFQSTDDGANWADYSTGLPDGPVNALAYDYQAGVLYAGTDIGVYYRRVNTGDQWRCYSENLPNTIITDLELDRCQRQLYASTFGRGAWRSDLYPNWDWNNTSDPYNTIIINWPTVWNTDQEIHKNVIIQPGAKLTIQNCTIHMDRGKNFIVENTGTMIVDHAIITNSCNCMWSDIILKGDTGVSQVNNVNTPLVNSTSNQGLLILDHATIENARNAILIGNAWYTGYDYPLWCPGGDGGVVMAENSTFHNCDRAFCFNAYTHKQHSFFKYCTFVADSFLKDDEYVNTTLGYPRRYGTESFATSWLSDGVYIKGCSFKTLPNARFNPDPDLRGVGWGCGACATRIDSCTFENLTRGTYISGQYGATSANTITNCTYTNIWRGATFLTDNNATFMYNKMTVGDPLPIDGWGHTQEEDPNNGMVLDPYGVYYSQAQTFTIQDNIIDKTSSTPFSYGIIMNNVCDGTIPTLSIYSLYRNTLKTHVGITANQDNRGVQIKCNKLLDDDYGILVSSIFTNTGSIPNNGQLSDQGHCNTGDGPADNEFNTAYPPCATGGEHIASLTQYRDNDFLYYQHTYAPYMATCHTAGHPGYSIIAPPVPCPHNCSGGNCCPNPPIIVGPPDPDEKMSAPLSDQMLQSITNEEKAIADLQKNIDNGKAPALVNAVGNANLGSTEVVSIISNAGNYLSDEILKKIINRQPALSYGELKKIIIANSGLRRSVWNELETALPALASDNDVIEAQKTISPRSGMEGAITDLYLRANQELKNLVTYYAYRDNWEAVAKLYDDRNAPSLAFPYYLRAKNAGKAAQMVSRISDKDLQTICMLQLERIKAGKMLQERLSETEEQTLRSIAKRPETRAGEAARNWLSMTTGERYLEVMPAIYKRNGDNQPDTKKDRAVYSSAVEIYPNPASNEVTIAQKGGKWNSGTMVSVYDVMGRKITNLLPDENAASLKLNTASWAPGSYIIVVQQPGKKADTHKLVIER